MKPARNRDKENEKRRALRRDEDWGTSYLVTEIRDGVKFTKAITPTGKYEPRESFMGQITGTWRDIK
jgi:hypothetical protein